MIKYKNRNETLCVDSYVIGPQFLVVRFKGNRVDPFYKYTYGGTGVSTIEHMIHLANKEEGLGPLIAKKVKTNYASKGSYSNAVLPD